MRSTGRRICANVISAANAAEVVSNCLDAIHSNRASEALPQLNDLKAKHVLVEGVDYARALCFLSRGVEGNIFEARQSLLEELRLHPHHQQAHLLLYEVNELVRPLLLPPAELQKQHPLFALLCDALLDSTMLSWPRLFHLYEATERLAQKRRGEVDCGHIVECGTAGGGSAVLMAVILAEAEAKMSGNAAQQKPQHLVFALDTFTGMPPPGREDSLILPRPSSSTATPDSSSSSPASWGAGTCCSSVEHVQLLARAFSVEDRLVLLPGLFHSSIPSQLLTRPDIQHDGVALLHVDADWYASTRTALELLVPVMRRGDKHGCSSHSPRMVQVDDYYYWKGCRTAVDEFLAEWRSSSHLKTPLLEDVDDNAVSFAVHRDTPFSIGDEGT